MAFDFETNAVVKDINIVPDQFRPLFAEDPAEKGVFKLRSDDSAVKGAVEAIVGLNKALRAERKISTDLKGRAVDLSPLTEFGTSPEEIKSGIQAKIDEFQEQLAKGKDAKLDLEKIKADIKAAHAKDLGTKDGTIKNLTTQLESILIDNALRSAIGDQSVDADLVLPFAKAFMRTSQEDGRFRAVVVDAEGSQRVNGATAQPMSPAELIADMKRNPKYAPLFKSEVPRGGGTPPGSTGARIPPAGTKLSSIDRISAGLRKAGI
jgi:hypothetical protein